MPSVSTRSLRDAACATPHPAVTTRVNGSTVSAQLRDVAAVDLGSNSFHMLVAREQEGQLQVIDRLRETVRLAAGLDEHGGLDNAARERAQDCLARFGQRLRGIPPERVRAVGTNTLRKLRDDGAFIADAERILGHEVEVIAGSEEARLIYSGVIQNEGALPPRRLVVDIGGGSTELIIGHDATPQLMESVGVGCVSFTQRFFPDGRIDRARLHEARLAARVAMEFFEQRYRRRGWDIAIGTSGSVRGAWRVMQGQGWTDTVITRDALERALAMTAAAGRVDKLGFPGLREDRQPVFPGGLAILAGVFDALGLETMRSSEYALREGVVHDLLGRLADRDIRAASVAALAKRHGVDRKQARAVERTALRLLAMAGDWPLASTEIAIVQRLMAWAAQLHEIGLAIAHDRYARHGEYILRHCDLAGFSQADKNLLATLVRLQRGKFSRRAIDALPRNWRQTLTRCAALFRLAVVVHRARTPLPRLPFTLTAQRRTLQLTFAAGWLDDHPLTRADLAIERDALKNVKLTLEIA